MSYDAYKLEKGKWYLKEDVIAINKKAAEKFEILVEGENGETDTKKIKNKWEDPTDGKSQSGANKHVADMPENESGERDSNKSKTNDKTKVSRKERNSKSNIYPLNESKKKKKKN
jgi:hypothetical protein